MTKTNSGKHDATIDILIERLEKNEYHQISKQVNYYNPGCQDIAGEIDVMAFKTDGPKSNLLLFEIKTYDRPTNYKKAVEQLDRSASHYEKFADKIYKFYVTTSIEDGLNIRRVK